METLFIDNYILKVNSTDNNNNKDTKDISLSLNKNKKDDLVTIADDNEYPILSKHLLIDYNTVVRNSAILNKMINFFETKYPHIAIEKKFLTGKESILGGITLDWREEKDWNSNRKKVESIVSKSLFNVYKTPDDLNLSKKHFYYYIQKFYIQKYKTHPFIDIYSTKTSKGDAFDCITYELIKSNYKDNNNGSIIYLGDSENDNSAFKKADISIGINSDNRLKPNLKCKYNLKFENLSMFLKKLIKNNFEFSESMLLQF
jgi:hydroxymethylpyrimidine pyrophosphatase-like HAD family hydrolase